MAGKFQTREHADADGDDGAPQILDRLIRQAERANASDIHLQMDGGEGHVAFRLDGLLSPTLTLPSDVAERVLGRIKFLARLKTYQESLPQDGRIDKNATGASSDIRVSTYPTVTGEKAVLRLFNRGEIRSLDSLGFPDACLAGVKQVLQHNSGLILLTGPAGSGKTTTIYACLGHLGAQQGRHIITIEDPVEQRVPGVMQTEINEAQGLDFACAARHLLRQDPQVLVIGEIRDEATASQAVRAALTGHLVITTLHAGSCHGVFERLMSLYTDPSAVAFSVELVLNQRLLRRVCKACKGAGCEDCLKTGFRGRIAAIEWLSMTGDVRPRVRDRDFGGIEPTGSLRASADMLVQAGTTRLEEVQRVLG